MHGKSCPFSGGYELVYFGSHLDMGEFVRSTGGWVVSRTFVPINLNLIERIIKNYTIID